MFAFTGAGGTIADAGTTDFPIAVTNTFTVRDINVQVTAIHPYDSDLQISLVAPNNAVTPLFLNSGGSGDGLKGAWFDDQGSTAVGAAAAPFSGTFQPASGLGALNGIAGAGT